MGRIHKGFYGIGLHKAAARIHVMEMFEQSGECPFYYQAREMRLKSGKKYYVIFEMRVKNDRAEGWVGRLLEASLTIKGGVPVELVEAGYIDFLKRDKEWVEICIRAWEAVFGENVNVCDPTSGIAGAGHHAMSSYVSQVGDHEMSGPALKKILEGHMTNKGFVEPPMRGGEEPQNRRLILAQLDFRRSGV